MLTITFAWEQYFFCMGAIRFQSVLCDGLGDGRMIPLALSLAWVMVEGFFCSIVLFSVLNVCSN